MLKSHTDYLSMTDTTIGQKIHFFRKRAGKSQMELETEVGASAGSISRIEKGNVNPTKETLAKIVEVLQLNAKEAAELFDIDISSQLNSILNVSLEINEAKTVDAVIRNAVDSIVRELNYSGAIILMLKGDDLFATQFSNTWYSDMVNKILPIPVENLKVSISHDKTHIATRAISENTPLTTHNLADFTTPPLPLHLTRVIAKVTGFQSGVCLPLNYDAEKIGAIFFTTNYQHTFEKDLQVLQSLTKLIALCIWQKREVK